MTMYGTSHGTPIVAAGSTAAGLAYTGANTLATILSAVTVMFTGFMLTRLSRRGLNATKTQ
jgi:uncharacterized transporter YbjL